MHASPLQVWQHNHIPPLLFSAAVCPSAGCRRQLFWALATRLVFQAFMLWISTCVLCGTWAPKKLLPGQTECTEKQELLLCRWKSNEVFYHQFLTASSFVVSRTSHSCNSYFRQIIVFSGRHFPDHWRRILKQLKAKLRCSSKETLSEAKILQRSLLPKPLHDSVASSGHSQMQCPCFPHYPPCSLNFFQLI